MPIRRRFEIPGLPMAAYGLLLVLILGCGQPPETAQVAPAYADTPETIQPEAVASELPVDHGVWNRNPWAGFSSEAEFKERVQELETLGYVAGTEPMPTVSGVITYKPEKAWNGTTLVLSSHDLEATLIDMEGQELHTWRYRPSQSWQRYDTEFEFEPGNFRLSPDSEIDRACFHRAWLFPNGDLLGLIYGFGLVKLDKDSNVLWRVSGPYHHEMAVTPDGAIYALSRRAGIMPQYHETELVLDELIVVHTPDGLPVREVSLLEAIRTSDFAPLLENKASHGEILHSNTLHVLDGRLADRIPAFRAGNVLTSFRDIDTIAVVDMDEAKVVWALKGLWRWQHDPRVTRDLTITVFDNLGVQEGEIGDPGHVGSRILEFDPLSQEIVWKFTGNNETPFYSPIVGSARRLPNGNMFISETRRGRYLEVTPDKEIVWEFINPNQAGSENQFIADIYGTLRFGPDFPLDWLADAE